MINTLVVALGGALGSVARYWIAVWAYPVSGSLPLGTICINILGSFAIGLFGAMTVASGRYPLGEPARVFFMVGVCGGFTTFSSFSLQTLELLRMGAVWRAAANIVLSVALCLGAVAIGYKAGAAMSGIHHVVQNPPEEEAA